MKSVNKQTILDSKISQSVSEKPCWQQLKTLNCLISIFIPISDGREKEKTFSEQIWQWTTTKRKYTLHACLVVFHNKFFYRRFHIYKFPNFIARPFCRLSLLFAAFFGMMNFVHFLWIVSHIFFSPVSSLSFHSNVYVCECRFMKCKLYL